MIEIKSRWGGNSYKFTVHKRFTPRFKRELKKFDEETEQATESIKGLFAVFRKLDIDYHYVLPLSIATKYNEDREDIRVKMLCINKTRYGVRARRCTWIQYDEKTAKKHLEKSERKMRSFARQNGICYE